MLAALALVFVNTLLFLEVIVIPAKVGNQEQEFKPSTHKSILFMVSCLRRDDSRKRGWQNPTDTDKSKLLM